MIATIRYGTENLEIKLPDTDIFDEYSARSESSFGGYDEFIQSVTDAEANLFNPVDADLIVVNDAYRPTPTSQILSWLFESRQLNSHADFLVATGCHPAPDNGQLKKIFGSLYNAIRDHIKIHDARDLSAMKEIGRDSFGSPVYLNKCILDADKIVIIGSVEPHYFAGFTGGRKSIFPGLCDYNTTVRNHNLAVNFNSAPAVLDGNPVADHLNSLINLVNPENIFSIQIVYGKDHSFASINCGSLIDSFTESCKLSEEIFVRKVPYHYDLIMAEVIPPLDANLYQLQKSLENCQTAVGDGGTVILFSPCSEGIGSDDFYRLSDNWNADLPYESTGQGNFGIHKLARVKNISQRINIYLYSDLDAGIPDKVFFKSAGDPQNIANNLYDNNSNMKTALVHDAGHVVLTVN
jgi:nickel-dependent lactate racemase